MAADQTDRRRFATRAAAADRAHEPRPIVLPCFDEEPNVAAAVAEARPAGGRFAARRTRSSSSTTAPPTPRARSPRRSPRADPRVRVVAHDRNRGYGAAVRSGIAAARCGWVLLTDGDLPVRPGRARALRCRSRPTTTSSPATASTAPTRCPPRWPRTPGTGSMRRTLRRPRARRRLRVQARSARRGRPRAGARERRRDGLTELLVRGALAGLADRRGGRAPPAAARGRAQRRRPARDPARVPRAPRAAAPSARGARGRRASRARLRRR